MTRESFVDNLWVAFFLVVLCVVLILIQLLTMPYVQASLLGAPPWHGFAMLAYGLLFALYCAIAAASALVIFSGAARLFMNERRYDRLMPQLIRVRETDTNTWLGAFISYFVTRIPPRQSERGP